MAEEDLTAEIERLKAENERLRKRQSRGLSMKVSQKGALSVYGLGRFPVTLYKQQWTKLLDTADDIRRFLEDNDAQLKVQGDARRKRVDATDTQPAMPLNVGSRLRALRRDRPHRRGGGMGEVYRARGQ